MENQIGDVQIFIQTEISLHTARLNLQVKCLQETNIRVQESRSPRVRQQREIFPLLRDTCGNVKAGSSGVGGETEGG